jgi:hypothetical protein
MPREKLRIIVSGLVGQYPMGGVAWDYFHYVLGLAELGHDVYYHEDTWVWPHDPRKGFPTDDPSYTVDFIRDFFNRYASHLSDRWHYVLLHEKHFGMTAEAFDEVARTADVFLNVSGACFFPDALNPRCRKVFMDTDPGYNQIVMATRPEWSQFVDRWIKQVRDHDVHLTYAENIYGDDCLIPRVGIDWRPTRCVATLVPWNTVKDRLLPPDAPFTTVMSWGYFNGPLVYNGVKYDAKASEYDKFHDLPRRTRVPLALAVGGVTTPVEQIKRDGWRLTDAWQDTVTPQSYFEFIARSAGEWSVAKNVYVATRSGWFSCRTACYLAAGRPAVVQDTGWSRFVPSGAGLFAFDTIEQSVDALDRVASDPTNQRTLAYDVAREYVAPDRVLPPMIDAIYATDRSTAALPPSHSQPATRNSQLSP